MIGAKYLKADMERAFLDAYYRLVRKCNTIGFDLEVTGNFVVVAGGPKKVWVMDFSSKYEFPAEMKQATVSRKLTDRAAAALDAGQRLGRLWGDLPWDSAVDVEYEIWCFMSPSERLRTAVDAARAAGAQFTLVMMDQVYDRVRQAALAVPADTDEDQAFVQAATMFKRAFGI